MFPIHTNEPYRGSRFERKTGQRVLFSFMMIGKSKCQGRRAYAISTSGGAAETTDASGTGTD
ncbi:hypothetical protein BPJM79_40212 [Bacillus pumilus]